MRVLVSVKRRFHAFDLAHQLQKHNMLYKLNTTYTKNVTQRWGIDSSKIRSNFMLEFLHRYAAKFFSRNIKRMIEKHTSIQQAKSNLKELDNIDIFIGWSESSLEALIEAKKKGVITILERGCSHYNYQMKILEEEYKLNNLEFHPTYIHWQRELLEYQLADYISIPSSFAKKTFLEEGFPEAKLLVNPYGVDLDNFRKIPKEDDIFRVVFAGGFAVRKGVKYLLQAFTELDLKNSELIHLGSVNEDTKPIIDNYKSEKIKFLGHKPQRELYKYYSQSDVFVLMSVEDGFGMVVFQAMSCELPIIVSENTVGHDAVTKNGEEGFVIPIRDVDMLKEKIKFLYDNPDLRKQMGLRARKRVETGFSWDDYGDRYVQNIKKVFDK